MKTKVPSQFYVQNIKAPGSLHSDLNLGDQHIEVSIVEDCLNDMHLSSLPVMENYPNEDLGNDEGPPRGRGQTYLELLAQHQVMKKKKI